MGRWSHNQENIPLDTAFSDDRQLKTESADSSLGLSNGRGGSRDINPAFDSESQDEVITLGPGLQGIDGFSLLSWLMDQSIDNTINHINAWFKSFQGNHFEKVF